MERFTILLNDIKFHLETFHIKQAIWYNVFFLDQSSMVNFDLFLDQQGSWQLQKSMDVPQDILDMKDLITDEIEKHNSLKWKSSFFNYKSEHSLSDRFEFSFEKN